MFDEKRVSSTIQTHNIKQGTWFTSIDEVASDLGLPRPRAGNREAWFAIVMRAVLDRPPRAERR